MAQWLEHPTRSQRVVGSNPIWGSDFFRVLLTFNLSCGCCFIFNNNINDNNNNNIIIIIMMMMMMIIIIINHILLLAKL